MPRESKSSRIRRISAIIAILRRRYPNARTALNWANPLQLLVATILSAQCTDKRVNGVTGALFRKYRTARSFANARLEELEEQIKSTGFHHNKAKNIRASAGRIVEDFAGRVPDNMAGLLTLPGVARKTANVVLGDAFGKREGIVVDTHVIRLAGRLKLTRFKNNQSDRIEKELMPLVPREDWTLFAHLLIFHGRETCTARKPNCPECRIRRLCPSAPEA